MSKQSKGALMLGKRFKSSQIACLVTWERFFRPLASSTYVRYNVKNSNSIDKKYWWILIQETKIKQLKSEVEKFSKIFEKFFQKMSPISRIVPEESSMLYNVLFLVKTEGAFKENNVEKSRIVPKKNARLEKKTSLKKQKSDIAQYFRTSTFSLIKRNIPRI